MSNLLIVFMLLFWLIPSIIFKQYMLALTFMVFGIVFGFIEFLSNYYTGHTVSQLVWDLFLSSKWKGITLIVCMGLGWLCLLTHLSMRFKKG